jgi:hypothetical protein
MPRGRGGMATALSRCSCRGSRLAKGRAALSDTRIHLFWSSDGCRRPFGRTALTTEGSNDPSAVGGPIPSVRHGKIVPQVGGHNQLRSIPGPGQPLLFCTPARDECAAVCYPEKARPSGSRRETGPTQKFWSWLSARPPNRYLQLIEGTGALDSSGYGSTSA